MKDQPDPKLVAFDKLIKDLVDRGRLTEAGWTSYRWAVLPKDVSAVQLTETRKAFYAGAQHLFMSMMSFLEAGQEPTAKDMDRMSKLSEELEQFAKELIANLGKRN
jgi:hypothetical protein